MSLGGQLGSCPRRQYFSTSALLMRFPTPSSPRSCQVLPDRYALPTVTCRLQKFALFESSVDMESSTTRPMLTFFYWFYRLVKHELRAAFGGSTPSTARQTVSEPTVRCFNRPRRSLPRSARRRRGPVSSRASGNEVEGTASFLNVPPSSGGPFVCSPIRCHPPHIRVPEDEHRAVGTIILGQRAIAIENHLVAVPKGMAPWRAVVVFWKDVTSARNIRLVEFQNSLSASNGGRRKGYSMAEIMPSGETTAPHREALSRSTPTLFLTLGQDSIQKTTQRPSLSW